MTNMRDQIVIFLHLCLVSLRLKVYVTILTKFLAYGLLESLQISFCFSFLTLAKRTKEG